jgi:PAS domain S-box-containing protein
MNWVTVIWSLSAGACLTLAFLQFMVWSKDRAARANFALALGAVAVAFFAGLELALMRAETPAQFDTVARWIHVPAWVLIVSIVAFVRLYLNAGRRWLAWTIVAVRTLSLILNFILSPNINYRKVTGLRHIPFLGESVSLPVGVPNPWMLVAQLSLLLLVIFAMDATITVWRRGDRRQALVVGGSIVLLVVLASAQAVAMTWGIAAMPLTVSLFYLILVAAMAYELSYDLIRAAQVTRQLQASEATLRESEQRFRIVADAAPVLIWMSGVNKLCTFFNKRWLDFTGRSLEQEMGYGWAEGVHRDDLQKCLNIYTEAFDARKPFAMQYRLRRNDEEYRWISDDGVPRYDADGAFTGYIGSCTDVTDLLAHEEALHEFEQRVVLAAEATHHGVWELNIATHELWMSDKARSLFQFDPDLTVDEEILQARLHPEDRAMWRSTLNHAIETEGEYAIEYRVLLRDGNVRWLAGRGRCLPVKHGKGNRLVCVSVDITSQKHAQDLFRLAAEGSRLGVWHWDEASQRISWDRAAQKMFGVSADAEITIDTFYGAVHPDDLERVKRARRQALELRLPYQIEYRTQRTDGTICWVHSRGRGDYDESGKPLSMSGVVFDITDRKKAEELFELATEASPNGVILINDQGLIILVNSQIEKVFGYTRDDLIGKPVEILLPERFGTSYGNDRADFFIAPEARTMGAHAQLFARRKDGSEVPVEIGVNPVQTPQGLIVLANVADVSARLAAEEGARRTREQVELLSRVSLLGEMTASLAHELNQPLAAIVNNATAAMQYLEQNRLNPEQLQEILADVVADGRRACDVMHSVRSAIKKGTAIRGRVNLNDLVKAITHMVQPDAAGHRCKIKASLEKDLQPIEGDPIQIQQALINLVRNAFDAMRDVPPNRRIVEITTDYNGDGAVGVAVRDYGSGISDSVRERLFEQFFTTKDEGLGMGLAIVRSIVEAHGGSITAENADGGGARFYFRLPVNEGASQ